MMRTQNVRQHDNAKKDMNKDRDREKDKDEDKDKEEHYEERSRERGSVDDSTDEYFSSNKNEFQINETIIRDDSKRKNSKNENSKNENSKNVNSKNENSKNVNSKNENSKNGNSKKEFSEEEIMKNSKNMSNYFRISENKLENLCKKIVKFNANTDSVSTTVDRVRAHDERGVLLKSCVFDAELSDLLETVLLDKDKDVYIVATGEKNYLSIFIFIFICFCFIAFYVFIIFLFVIFPAFFRFVCCVVVCLTMFLETCCFKDAVCDDLFNS